MSGQRQLKPGCYDGKVIYVDVDRIVFPSHYFRLDTFEVVPIVRIPGYPHVSRCFLLSLIKSSQIWKDFIHPVLVSSVSHGSNVAAWTQVTVGLPGMLGKIDSWNVNKPGVAMFQGKGYKVY